MSSEPDSPDSRFPRSARLTLPREYQRVFAGAKRLGDRYFTVLATVNELEHPRLGMAVSRRNARRAVDRNRLKRLIRESYRRLQPPLAGFDLVVIPKPAALTVDNETLRRSLAEQWRRLRKS